MDHICGGKSAVLALLEISGGWSSVGSSPLLFLIAETADAHLCFATHWFGSLDNRKDWLLGHFLKTCQVLGSSMPLLNLASLASPGSPTPPPEYISSFKATTKLSLFLFSFTLTFSAAHEYAGTCWVESRYGHLFLCLSFPNCIFGAGWWGTAMSHTCCVPLGTLLNLFAVGLSLKWGKCLGQRQPGRNETFNMSLEPCH